jgi:Uma2 family endonuclease
VKTLPKSVTAEELLTMPDNGMRRELLWGMLKEMTPAGYRHGQVTGNLVHYLDNHCRKMRLGVVLAAETGFVLARNPDLVRAPDVAFIRKEKLPIPDQVKYAEGAPSLAVEVLSPRDAFSEVEEKVRCWLDHGSEEVWVVDPVNERILIYRPEGDVRDLPPTATLASESLLPGFRLTVRDVFQR